MGFWDTIGKGIKYIGSEISDSLERQKQLKSEWQYESDDFLLRQVATQRPNTLPKAEPSAAFSILVDRYGSSTAQEMVRIYRMSR